ncbi:hypothetical protein ACQRUO_00510, partial [Kitasatospora sp. LaBMicrA B282]
LARVAARAASAGSEHHPHPDPRQMGLSIGEGQDGSPLRWGRWDGQAVTVDPYGDQDLVLLAVSPSGDRLLTVSHDQERLAVHEVGDGSVITELDAAARLPRHPGAAPDNDEALPYWDWAGGFLDEQTVITGSLESDEEWGAGRHWLLDTGAGSGAVPELVAYPFPVPGLPTAIGDGTWYTAADAGHTLHVWARG